MAGVSVFRRITSHFTASLLSTYPSLLSPPNQYVAPVYSPRQGLSVRAPPRYSITSQANSPGIGGGGSGAFCGDVPRPLRAPPQAIYSLFLRMSLTMMSAAANSVTLCCAQPMTGN